MIEKPIITSLIDDDLYKINMGSVVFHLFPEAVVTYKFFNRGKVPFPKGFDKALQLQIRWLAQLRLDWTEGIWLKKIPYIRPTYVEWLSGYSMNPDEVDVKQDKAGFLDITVHGPWYRTIFWEVKLMAIISELYFDMTGQKKTLDVEAITQKKAAELEANGCHWIDFGTRRRYSKSVQDKVVKTMLNYKGFLGTSNPHFACRYGITPHGTYAHESVMAMSALYGVRMANKMWMKHWSEHFEGNVGVALTDTFTTDKFLQDFGTYEARLFDGVRQDSGDPMEWAHRMLKHYRDLGIPTSNKRFVFSDALTTRKYVDIETQLTGLCQAVGGIGTHFTNDVGVKPLNMVIKMTSADFGQGNVDVIKLSDDKGKHTGNPVAIERAKGELNIA